MSGRSGYDPAWSPDGTRIAFVRTDYKREGDWGLFLDNDSDKPTARDSVVIWDLDDNTTREVRPAACRGRFLFALAWLDDDWLVCVGTDPAGIDPDAAAWKDLWDHTFAYRAAPWPKQVFALNVESGEARTLMSAVHALHVERLDDMQERAVVWCAVKDGNDQLVFTGVALNPAGEVSRELRLPHGDWSGPAIAALSDRGLIAVRRTEGGKMCLSAVNDGVFSDVYCPGRTIIGVYGSPDRRRVAFCEEKEGVPPGTSARVVESAWDFAGSAKAIVQDAYPGSTLAWAPDGGHIAYVRCDDGRIVIAEVPPLS